MENENQLANPSQPPQNKLLYDVVISKQIVKKMLLIVLLLIIVQIPLLFISFYTDFRQEKYNEVVREIGRKWGISQHVCYADHVIANNPVKPEKIEATAYLTPEVRYRGIYQVVVYNATAKIKATFVEPVTDFKFYLSSVSNIENISANVNGKQIETTVDTKNRAINVPGKYDKNAVIELEMKFRGSESFGIELGAKYNTVTIAGDWGTPSFSGDMLPAVRTVENNKFSATWNATNLSNAPLSARVDLKISSGSYQQVLRCQNYAFLFLVVFFFALAVGEVFTKIRLHPVQYIVAAGAPVLFYLMLLALAEHINFPAAYIVSSAVVVAMITMYARMFYGKLKPAVILGACFAVSYVCNYLLLQIEDFALLIGTVILTLILGTVMVLTGRLNRN